MGLVPAKCTNCGGTLEVDSTKEAAICPHCGSAFIVEKAINNYNTTYHVNNDIHNSVVNIFENREFSAESNFKKAKSYCDICDFEKSLYFLSEAHRLDKNNGEYFFWWIMFNLDYKNKNEDTRVIYHPNSNAKSYFESYCDKYQIIQEWEKNFFEFLKDEMSPDYFYVFKIEYAQFVFNKADEHRCKFVFQNYFEGNLGDELLFLENNIFSYDYKHKSHFDFQEACNRIPQMRILFQNDCLDLFNPFKKHEQKYAMETRVAGYPVTKYYDADNMSLFDYANGKRKRMLEQIDSEIYPEMLELINDFFTIPNEAITDKIKYEKELKRNNICRYCFGELKILSKKCKKCGRQN